jgi:CRP-like cAMP-binding protein
MADGDRSAPLVREIFLAGFMAGLPPENIAWATPRLARNMVDVHLRAGEVLYREGEPTNEHWFVVYGEMKLEAKGVPPWVLGERSLIGTIDLTLDRARSRTATATRDTHLLCMPASDWLDVLEDNFEMLLRGVEGLAEGVHELRLALGDFETEHGGQRNAYTRAPANGRLALLDRMFLLRGVPLFAEAEVQALINLAENAHEAEAAAGELVVTRGEPNDSMIVVVSGEVTVPVAGSRDETFGPGMLVFGSRAASSKDLGCEGRAVSATRTLRIVREDYFDAMEEHFALARSSMKALAAEREELVNEKGRRAAPGRAAVTDSPPT